MKMMAPLRGEVEVAKQTNVASSTMIITQDETFVKVTEVNAAVARSRWKINWSMLRCENICGNTEGCNKLRRTGLTELG